MLTVDTVTLTVTLAYRNASDLGVCQVVDSNTVTLLSIAYGGGDGPGGGRAEENGKLPLASTLLSTVLDRTTTETSNPPTRGGRVPWTTTSTPRVTRSPL